MLVPRLGEEVRNMTVSKIKYRMEPGEIVSSGKQPQNDRHDRKPDERRAGVAQGLSPTGQAVHLLPQRSNPEVDKNRQNQDQLGSIAKSEGEESSSPKRAGSNESEVKGSRFAEKRESKGNLPGAGKPEIAPHPGREDGKKSEQNSARQRLSWSR